MIVVPFKPEHLQMLRLQPAQEFVRPKLEEAGYAQFCAGTKAFTLFDGETVLGCGGLYQYWPGRGQVWALLAGAVGPRQMVRVHRIVERFLDMADCRRIEAVVKSDFAAGHRWIKALGFVCETPEGMPGYDPDGHAYHLYTRTR